MTETPGLASDGAVVRVENISKTFPGTKALTDAGLNLVPGEIHALVGGNGSGKSTLIKILSGVYQADPGGVITVKGHVIEADSITPEFARSAGIRVVHQDLGVFPDMSVAENLALGSGYQTGLGGRVAWRQLRRHAEALIEQFEIQARPDDMLRHLSQATKALVAIARACQVTEHGEARLLILDEPTASLAAHEARMLLDRLRSYATTGISILYVSHRLDEIMEICDRVTALRDGAVAGTFETNTLTQHDLVELIVGSPLDRITAQGRTPSATAVQRKTVIEVEDLRVGPVRGVNLEVGEGEVVGIAGLLGSGRSTVLRSLFGLARPEAGEIRLDGKSVKLRSPRQAMDAGIAFVPETRADAGFFDMTITQNIVAARIPSYASKARFNHQRARSEALSLSRAFGVKTASLESPLATLSGGNQQKVILARWISRQPRLLLLDEPDQGVDVGARADIWRLVREAADSGMAVLVVASDLEELAHVVDRAVVLRDGEVVAHVEGERLDAKRLTHLAYFGAHAPSGKDDLQ